MRFIDHKIIQRDFQRLVASPVVIFSDDLPPVGKRILKIRLFSPYTSSADRLCIGIQEDLFPVIQKSFFRGIGSIETIAVFRSLYIDVEKHDGKDISDPESLRDRDFHERFFRPVMKKQKRTAGRFF